MRAGPHGGQRGAAGRDGGLGGHTRRVRLLVLQGMHRFIHHVQDISELGYVHVPIRHVPIRPIIIPSLKLELPQVMGVERWLAVPPLPWVCICTQLHVRASGGFWRMTAMTRTVGTSPHAGVEQRDSHPWECGVPSTDDGHCSYGRAHPAGEPEQGGMQGA